MRVLERKKGTKRGIQNYAFTNIFKFIQTKGKKPTTWLSNFFLIIRKYAILFGTRMGTWQETLLVKYLVNGSYTYTDAFKALIIMIITCSKKNYDYYYLISFSIYICVIYYWFVLPSQWEGELQRPFLLPRLLQSERKHQD